MKLIRVLIAGLMLLQLGACSPEPELVYSYDTPDLDTPDDDPLPGIAEGDDAIVTLRNGERFEAKYRGIAAGALEFENVEWKEPADRANDPVMTCAIDDVSEIRRTDWGTADTIVAVVSITALGVILAVYGRGHGAE